MKLEGNSMKRGTKGRYGLFLLAAVAAFLTLRGNAQFLADGELRIGCNYWASHAGMMMWRNWDGAQVEKDLDALAGHGVEILRVFPLWPDFQPITIRRGFGGNFTEWAQNDGPFYNPEGVDEKMLARFRFLCDAAEKRGQKLVVGLITGWMSGRTFVPPAFDGRNVLVDPAARMWQVRFVRKFVRNLKDHPAIAAWDLGNECNCLGGTSAEESWNWLNEIASAIRLEDPSRRVVSGMHSLSMDRNASWNMRMQGELMDVLTTHPYPLWTPDMNHEPFNSLRNGLHATAESLLYAGVSGKPCFVEEAGDMGRNVCSEARAAANVRMALCSSWAHGLGAYVWWCAFDQGHLGFPPYTWTAVECDLGLFGKDFRAKQVLVEMKRFSDFLKDFPHRRLPPRQIDAVCLVSDREHFPAAPLGAFCLAKQAGFDIAFAGAEGPLPESAFYVLPSGKGYNPYSGEAYANVLAKVRAGATLLVTKGNETAMPFVRETTGNEIDYVTKDPLSAAMTLKAFPGKTISVRASTTCCILSRESDVIGRDADGNPMMTVMEYGKGRVVYVNFAPESDAFLKGGAYFGKDLNPLYLIYREAARIAGVERVVCKPADVANVGFTEHRLDGGRMLAVAVNYDPSPAVVELSVKGRISRVWGDGTLDGNRLALGANGFCVLEID